MAPHPAKIVTTYTIRRHTLVRQSMLLSKFRHPVGRVAQTGSAERPKTIKNRSARRDDLLVWTMCRTFLATDFGNESSVCPCAYLGTYGTILLS